MLTFISDVLALLGVLVMVPAVILAYLGLAGASTPAPDPYGSAQDTAGSRAPRMLTCPRCSASVEVPQGQKPRCQACGFGGRPS